MIKIRLKDGSEKEIVEGTSLKEVAKQISEGLGRVATCGSFNGEIKDIRYKIEEEGEVEIHSFERDKEGKQAYWHTTSHIMAQAVKRLFPKAKLGIGPAIEEGFYYDFEVEKPFSQEDKEKIEEEMKKIIKEDIEIKRYVLSKEEAIALMKEREEPYKVELIEELEEEEEISIYEQGEFIDLCAGPHLSRTGEVKAIKLLNSSAAYWRGDENKQTLQRIYGISFPKATKLKEYLEMLEEAKKRDHNKLGR